MRLNFWRVGGKWSSIKTLFQEWWHGRGAKKDQIQAVRTLLQTTKPKPPKKGMVWSINYTEGEGGGLRGREAVICTRKASDSEWSNCLQKISPQSHFSCPYLQKEIFGWRSCVIEISNSMKLERFVCIRGMQRVRKSEEWFKKREWF